MLKIMQFRARWLPAILLLWASFQLHGQSYLVQAEYFIDNDPGPGQAIAIPLTPGDSIDAAFTAPITGYDVGWHLFCARVRSSNGLWVNSWSKLFYINPYEWYIPPLEEQDNPLVEAEYFIDIDPGEGMGIRLNIPVGDEFDIIRLLNTDTLSPGSYTAGIRVKELNGTWSSTFGVNFGIYNNPPCLVPNPDFSFTQANQGQAISFNNTSTNVLSGATYLWSMMGSDTTLYTSLNSTHTFDSAGVYDVMLTVSNGNDSCTMSVVKQVEVGPYYSTAIVVNGNTTFCSGDSVMLTAPAGSDWLWSNSEETQTIAAKEQGSYQAFYTDQNGNLAVSDVIEVVVFPSPAVALTVNTASDNLANGSAGLEVSGGSAWIYDYTWSSGSTMETETGLTAGVYTVTVDDQVCPQTIDVVIPNLTTQGNGIVAAEYFVDADPGVGNGVPISLNWSAETSTFVHIPITSIAHGWHILTVRVKDNTGLWSFGHAYHYFIQPAIYPQIPHTSLVNMEVYFDEDPGMGNGEQVLINPSQDSIQQLLTTSIASLNTGYHRVFVRAKNDEGVWGIDGFKDFLVDIILPAVDTTQYPLVAAEYFFDEDPGEGNGESIYIPAGDTIDITRSPAYTELLPGIHKIAVRVRDLKGNWSVPKSSTFTIYEATCTTPLVSFSHTAAIVNQVVPFTNTSLDVDPGASYSWDIFADGIIDYTTENMSYTFTSTGAFPVLLKVMNSDSCLSSYTTIVEVGPGYSADIIASGSTFLCDGQTVDLTAPMGSNYLWSTGASSATITVGVAASYEVAYTDLNGVYRVSNPISITVYPSIETNITVSAANGIQANGSANVEISKGTGYLHSFNWSNGTTTQALANVTSGIYILTVSDTHCPAIIDVEIPQATSPNGLIDAEYFMGADPGPGNGNPILITYAEMINSYFNIDMAGVPPGYHDMFFRVKEESGLWGHAKRLQVNVPEEVPVVQDTALLVEAEYFYDSDPGVLMGTDIPGIPIAPSVDFNFNADVSMLDPGYHTLLLRVKDSENKWSTVGFMNFYMEQEIALPDTNQYPLVAAEIFFDDDPGEGNGISIPLSNALEIDVFKTIAGICQTNGNKRAYLRVKQLDGQWSLVQPFDYSVYNVSNCDVPVVDFTNTQANAGNPMLFSDQSSNVASGALYEWDINADGSVEYTTSTMLHTFTTSGVYDVRLTVTNSFVCFSSIVKTIEVGPYYDNLITVSGPTTFCGGDSIMLTAPLGINYLWSTGETTSSIAVHDQGSYQVSYTNLSGVQQVSNLLETFVYPEIFTDVFTSFANTGMANGSANVEVTGGSSYFYNFTWSTGEALPLAVNLTAGNYTVTVSDINCAKMLDVNIGSIGLPTDGIVAAEYFLNTDPGVGNGTAVMINQGDEIDSYFQISMAGFTPGYYILYFRVKRGSGLWGHVKPLFLTISDWSVEPPYPLPDVVDMEYYFDSPGLGEDSAIHYSSFVPAQSIDENITVSTAGIGFGEHIISFRVKDDEGEWSCVKSAQVQLCDPPLQPYAGSDTMLCEGTSINLSGFSSQPNITYYWEGPNGYTSNQQNPVIANATPEMEGFYMLYAVKDGDCFSDPDYVEVIVNPLPLDAEDIISSGASCQDTSTVVYFVPPIPNAYQYEWTFPDSVVILAGNNTNNIAINYSNYLGNFDLKVRGSNLCGIGNWSSVLPVDVEVPPVSTCPGDTTINASDGLIVLSGATPVGGIYQGNGIMGNSFYPSLSGPGQHEINYFYFSPGGCAGICQFTITVMSNCMAPTNVVTTSLAQNSVSFSWIPGGSENEWDIVYGLPGFDPLSSGSQISSVSGNQYTILNLVPLTSYDIYVRAVCDASDVSSWTGPLSVTLNAGITFDGISSPATCDNGTIALSNFSGTSPYAFLWSNGALVQNPNNLSAGEYIVTVTDNLGSSGVDTFVVGLDTISVVATISNEINMQSDGEVDIFVTGGQTPYAFIWSNSETSEDLAGISAGTYHVSISDANSCQYIKTVLVENTITYITQQLVLDSSWNLSSFYVSPLDSTRDTVFGPVLPNILQIKDPFHSYDASWNEMFNSLKHTEDGMGYWIQTNQTCTLDVNGFPIDPSELTFEMDSHWNAMAFIGQQPMDLETAFADLMPVLVDVKHTTAFWSINNPAWMNTWNTLMPGEGYYVRLSADTIFNYPSATKGSGSVNVNQDMPYKPKVYPNSTACLAELILPDTTLLTGDDWILADIAGELRGVGKVISNDGRHYSSILINGVVSETVSFELHTANGSYISQTLATTFPGDNLGVFTEPLPLHFGTTEQETLILPEKLLELEVYPNPFYDELTIRFFVDNDKKTTLEIFNSLGVKVFSMQSDHLSFGMNQLYWKGNLPNVGNCRSGVYHIVLRSGDVVQSKNVIYFTKLKK